MQTKNFNTMLNYIYSLLLVICLSTQAFALPFNDQDGKINQKDDQGKKQGKWIYFGKDRPEEGIPAEGKVEEGAFKDDRKEGTWIKYHSDGVTPRLKGEYSFGRPKGKYTRIYPNGVIKEVGVFDKNQYKDSLSRFYENGKTEYVGFYNEAGKEQGKIKHYYANGQLAFEYDANNGVLRGKAVRYHENGDIKEIIMFNEDGTVKSSEEREPVKQNVVVKDPGVKDIPAPAVSKKGADFKPNDYNKCFNKNGEIDQDGVFKNGSLYDGKLYVYDRDGLLVKVKIFKNGKFHSEGQL